MKRIYEEAGRLLDVFRPDVAAIERLYFKQNVTTGISVAQSRGVLALAVAQAGIPILEFSPTEIKTAITGYGKADKRQMQEMIRDSAESRSHSQPDDAADALGLAIAAFHAGKVARGIRESWES